MASQMNSLLRSVHPSSDESNHPVIAAIDVGTSRSGYAFWFRNKGLDEFRLSDIQLNKWQRDAASSSTEKAPTTVLLKPDKTFDSFGYTAEDKYTSLCDTNQHKKWWFFRKFKMRLDILEVSRDMTLEDEEGRTISAKDVFSFVIDYLKDCIIEDVRKQNPNIKDDDILYVLTVPSSWSESGKQFIYEAAAVTIKEKQLKLVLEPEAASVYCQHRDSCIIREENGKSRLESLEVGHQYMILDIGGGTVDIVMHEIIENGRVQEIEHARGNNIGGETFNESFLQFLRELFGDTIFKEWSKSKPGDYLRLQRAIEGIKWYVGDNDDDIVFEIPYSLLKLVKKRSKKIINVLSKSKFSSDSEVIDSGQLRLRNSFVRGFFDTILTGMLNFIIEITQSLSAMKTVFIVGALAKSSYIVKLIDSQFHKCTFIVPEDPGVFVLKGAVMLGNKPQLIAGRIARSSYDIHDMRPLVNGKQDAQYQKNMDGEKSSHNVLHTLHTLIEKGKSLWYG